MQICGEPNGEAVKKAQEKHRSTRTAAKVYREAGRVTAKLLKLFKTLDKKRKNIKNCKGKRPSNV